MMRYCILLIFLCRFTSAIHAETRMSIQTSGESHIIESFLKRIACEYDRIQIDDERMPVTLFPYGIRYTVKLYSVFNKNYLVASVQASATRITYFRTHSDASKSSEFPRVSDIGSLPVEMYDSLRRIVPPGEYAVAVLTGSAKKEQVSTVISRRVTREIPWGVLVDGDVYFSPALHISVSKDGKTVKSYGEPPDLGYSGLLRISCMDAVYSAIEATQEYYSRSIITRSSEKSWSITQAAYIETAYCLKNLGWKTGEQAWEAEARLCHVIMVKTVEKMKKNNFYMAVDAETGKVIASLNVPRL